MKTILAIFVLLTLSACGFVFAPGYSSADRNYFAERPVVVKNGEQYSLRWRYGTMGFYFRPSYKVRNGALVFSLQGTSSSGSHAGREQMMLIEGARTIEALKKGGAFWWELDDSLIPLAIEDETNTSSPPR